MLGVRHGRGSGLHGNTAVSTTVARLLRVGLAIRSRRTCQVIYSAAGIFCATR
jgi:hypothetical protein